MRIMLRVAYDGTNYSGWQIQPNAVTVEGVLHEAINDLFKTEIEVIGASRTDAGVHAMGNVAVFDVDTRIAPEKIAYAPLWKVHGFTLAPACMLNLRPTPAPTSALTVPKLT